MKTIFRLVLALFLFPFAAFGQTPQQTTVTTPTAVQFNFRAGHIYEVVFQVGDEKVVHHWSYMRQEWQEDITISSPTLAARKFAIGGFAGMGTLASGFPDAYEIRNGNWERMEPPSVPVVIHDRYRQYLRIAQDLSAGHWPGILPR